MMMANQYTRETFTLYYQYKFLSRQLDVWCDQYDSWKARQQRALEQRHNTFQHVLYIRLMIMERMLKNLNRLVDDKADELIVAASLSNDMDLLDVVGIEILP